MPPKCPKCQTYHSQRKPCTTDLAQSAPSAEPIHKHRCMRCDEEFDCQTPDICQANYDVMPMILTKKENIVYTGEHCPFSPNWDWIRAYAKRYAALRTAQLERERNEALELNRAEREATLKHQNFILEITHIWKTRAETAESALRDACEKIDRLETQAQFHKY